MKEGWKIQRIVSYMLLMNFLPMGSKHCNIDKRNVWTARGTVEKLTSFGHIPWEYFGQPINFSADPHIYIYIYIGLAIREKLTRYPPKMSLSLLFLSWQWIHYWRRFVDGDGVQWKQWFFMVWMSSNFFVLSSLILAVSQIMSHQWWWKQWLSGRG